MNLINKAFYMLVFIVAGVLTALVFALAVLTCNINIIYFVVPIILFANVVGLVLHYKLWKAIQDPYSIVTPGKAVGYLFVPFYNIYWLFRSIYGFAVEHNDYIQRREIETKKLPSPIYLLQCVLVICMAVLAPMDMDWATALYFLVSLVAYFNFLIITHLSVNAVNVLYNSQRFEEKLLGGSP